MKFHGNSAKVDYIALAAHILFCDDVAVDDGEGSNARQHQPLQNLRSQTRSVDETNMRRFQFRLAVIAPESGINS